jgi:hypothetical protein
VLARISDEGSGTAVVWKVPVGAVLSIMKKLAVVVSCKIAAAGNIRELSCPPIPFSLR